MSGPKRLNRAGGAPAPRTSSAKAGRGVKVLSFDSIGAYGDYVASLEAGGVFGIPSARYSSRNATCSERWCFNTPLDEAITMAQAGGYWPEGARDLQAVPINAAMVTDKYTIVPTLELSVVGGYVDAGEYLHGNPECLLGIHEETPDKPVISLAVMLNARADIDGQSRMYYGRAVLALIDALEQQGYSVELTGVDARAGEGHKNGHETEIILKRAGDTWNAGALAYALAHPAFSRRLGFRVTEALPESAALTKNDYGGGAGTRRPNADIFLPWLTYHFAKPKRALDHVLKLAAQQRPDLLS